MKTPTAPPCFTDSASWVRFLVSAQGGKNKPFAPDGTYRRGFNFCTDCTLEHSVQMCVDGKCFPSFHRSSQETNHVENV